MTDIFTSDRQPQQARFQNFCQGIEHQTLDGAPWIAYFTHPLESKTTRIEIRQDLFGDWSASRYTSSQVTRKSYTALEQTCKLAFRWSTHLERKGMLKTIESGKSALAAPFLTETNIFDFESDEPEWVQGLIAAFTLHNDWVDLATCLSLSADEYVDANWRRFRDWLLTVRQRHHSDREVFAFGLAVWRAYRQDVLV